MADAEKTPIDQGIIARVTGALKVLTGQRQAVDTAWFGPLTPLQPNVPAEQQESVRGRALDFPSGYNTRMTPRAGENVTFFQMRALADSCDILRLVIETRKDQIAKMKFGISPINDDADHDDRCKEIEAFLRLPDGENTWNDWLRMVMEEMLVTDALAIYPWLNNDGSPYRFDLIDGATIKRVIDEHGRTPAPPYPAYQQILKGVVAVDYNSDELVYAPRNKRIHKIYGYSPVEQIIMTVNIALRRSLHQLQYYTEGSAPDLLFQVPADWNMTQIKEFNDWWQNSLAGNTSARRKAQFVPNGVTPINTKEGILKDPYDEWLARIICYAFNVSAQPFIKENNRSTAETAQAMALEEGLYPIMLWVKGVIDMLIWKYFGYRDLEFKWEDREATDPKDQNEMDDRNVKNGTSTINEIRAKRGDAPVEGGDVAMVLTASGYVPIIPKEPEPTPPQLIPPTDPNAPKPPQGPTSDDPAVDASKEGQAPHSGADDKQGVYKRFRKAAKSKKVRQIDRKTPAHKKIEEDLAKGVYNLLQKQMKKLAGAVVTKVVKGDRGETDLLDNIEWQGWEEFQDLFGDQLALASKKGVLDAYAQIDIDNPDALELANDEAIAYAKDRAAELVGKKVDENGDVVDNPDSAYSIEDSTREMIRSDVVQAMEQGLSNDDLAAMLEENYAFSETRAETIARTETALADCRGNLVLYTKSGLVDSKQWITGAGCCEDCQEVDGETVALDGMFSIGVDAPPAHPNCRCDFIPVLTDENEEAD